MARAIWSGSINFGLLNVPVKLYSAVSKQTIRFRELREGDGARIRHKRVAESDGKEVPYEKIVKGYEFAPDQYVVLGRDELAELDPKKTRSIEIQDFVDIEDVDPIYFEQPYYLGPDKGAEKAYALLVEAMKQSRKAAIARFVLRNKEHLAAIRPMGEVLAMATMRFHDEVTDPKDLDTDLFPEEKPRKPAKRELEMAQRLIDSLSTDFKADKYRDEYREELLAMLERKAAGKEVVSAPSEEPEPTKAPDLMAALEESLAAVRGEPAPAGSDGAKGNGAKSKPAKKTTAKRKTSTRAKSTSRSSSKSPAKSKPKPMSKAKAGGRK
jgi:DNA end-binding protein Ku